MNRILAPTVLVSALLLFSCATFKIQPPFRDASTANKVSLEDFKIEPSYYLSLLRLDLIVKETTQASSTGSGSSKVSYSSKERVAYQELCVSLGNGLWVDISGNLFLDIPFVLKTKATDYYYETRAAMVKKQGSHLQTIRRNIVNIDNTYEISEDAVFKPIAKKTRPVIVKTPRGYVQNTYSVFGTLTDVNGVERSPESEIISTDTVFSDLQVLQNSPKSVTIKSTYMKQKDIVVLEIIDACTIRISVNSQPFDLIYQDSTITLINKARFGTRIELLNNQIAVHYSPVPRSLYEKLFNSKKYLISIR